MSLGGVVAVVGACLMLVGPTGAAVRSPEAGGLIAFVRDGDIFTIANDGTGLRRLTRHPNREDDLSWSPDGARIAFVRHVTVGFDRVEPVTQPAIFVVDANGTGLRRLSPKGAHDEDPVWSPDGRSLAFARSADVVDGLETDIWVMNADGTNARRLTRHPVLDRDPVWSPDGRTIAFARWWPDSVHVHLMNADGTNQHRLLAQRVQTCCPEWSPDGLRLAFLGWDDKRLYTARRGGRNVRVVGRGADVLSGRPAWSPDGETIAFMRGYLNTELWFVRADGRGLHRPIRGASASSWSPDGQAIAFTKGLDLWVMQADGTGVHRLTMDASDVWDDSPTWQPARP
jgi:Tol biopolymer transport system component